MEFTEATTNINDVNNSAVDLIQAADVEVKTVAEVVKKAKSRSVNLATIVTTLKGVTREELEQATPGVIKELLVEATRINTEYKDILLGT